MKKQIRMLPAVAGLMALSASQIHAGNGIQTNANLLGGLSNTDEFHSIVSTEKQVMYLTTDSKILKNKEPVSSAVVTQSKGSTVQILDVDGDYAKVLSESGATGYVSLDVLSSKPETIFTTTDSTLYASTDLELKAYPYASSEVVRSLESNSSVHVIGTNDYEYWQVEVDGNTYYVNHNNLTEEQKPIVVVQETTATTTTAYTDSSAYIGEWSGAVLTPSAGTIMGPSGKETYYNLNMSGVVAIMQSMGINLEYWVRADGVKMYGDYIMIAADLSIPGRSRGSIVQTSLGAGMVCDTGSFIYTNPYQIDIAVDW